MAGMIRRRGEPTGRAIEAFDPFRMMREMMRFDPFDLAERGGFSTMAPFTPAFEVKETKDAYLFKADLPGIKEEDLEISISGNQIVISGNREEERTEDEGERYYAYERSFGSFSRSFTLPQGADLDHVNAALKEGVLTLTISKKPEVQPKKIAITGSKQAEGSAKA